MAAEPWKTEATAEVDSNGDPIYFMQEKESKRDTLGASREMPGRIEEYTIPQIDRMIAGHQGRITDADTLKINEQGHIDRLEAMKIRIAAI